MYSTFSDMIQAVFGFYLSLPIQTFGLFVAVAFLIASFILSKELKWKEKLGLLHPTREKNGMINTAYFIKIVVCKATLDWFYGTLHS